MLNQVIIVGRIFKITKEDINHKDMAKVTIAVPRSFKNINGEYETDFIDCTLWDVIAKSTFEYCKKGGVIGIKGRIENCNEGSGIRVVAEKVTFLSSKQIDNEEVNNGVSN